MSGPLVVLGDVLLDIDVVGTVERVAPDAPVPVLDVTDEIERPGGAALAALLAAQDGCEVVLIAPVADDAAGDRLRALLAPHLTLVAVPWNGSTPVKRRVRAAGQSLVRLDTGGRAGAVGRLPAPALAALGSAAAVLVSDYGRGAAQAWGVQARATAGRAPLVWDPHPRGPRPCAGATLVTPNDSESRRAAAGFGVPTDEDGIDAVSRRADVLVAGWGVGAVAITRGARGALVSHGSGAPLVVPAVATAAGDPCGAGDRFAATAACLLADGALTTEAVQGAVEAASAFVAAGGAAGVTLPSCDSGRVTPATAGDDVRPRDSAVQLARRIRSGGGTVVATGGCFDLLHAGHVSTLRAARALGDCLIVCLNSDSSVRRLKGSGRPLQSETDRRSLLQALECVDAVMVFDEDTPADALSRLRPHVWAKGGDYAGVELPESALLQTWGGTSVVLPYLVGRSTTSLVGTARDGVRTNGVHQ